MPHPSIKIFSAYHKPAPLFRNGIVTPVHAGREAARRTVGKGGLSEREYAWMLENMPGDDSGEHISGLNPRFAEMTVIYWAWRNYAALGSPDYVGFCHYRRFFDFSGQLPRPSMRVADMSPEQFEALSSEARIRAVVPLHDVCLKTPAPNPGTVLQQYADCGLPLADLLTAFRLAGEKYPDFLPCTEAYARADRHHVCNMFIMRKDLFFSYAEWMFDILFAADALVDYSLHPPNDRRVAAYLAERLTGVYLTWLRSRPELRARELNVALHCQSSPFDPDSRKM